MKYLRIWKNDKGPANVKFSLARSGLSYTNGRERRRIVQAGYCRRRSARFLVWSLCVGVG
jgi:hypothetical protein